MSISVPRFFPKASFGTQGLETGGLMMPQDTKKATLEAIHESVSSSFFSFPNYQLLGAWS